MCSSPDRDLPEVSHEAIAKRLRLARTTVTRILNNDPAYRASAATRDKVMRTAETLGYDFTRLRRIHRRREERYQTDFEARVRIAYEDGRVFDEGMCTVKNLSLTGALLCNLRLGKGVLPLARLLVHIEVVSGPLANVPLRGGIARYVFINEAQIGVSFSGFDEEVLGRLQDALNVIQGRTGSPPQGIGAFCHRDDV